MVFRSRSVREGGWGREGLFAGRSHSGRARAAPGKACTSDGTRRRARAPTSPDFKPRVPCACACVRAYVCTGPREAREPARSKMGRDDGAAEMWFHPMWQDLASAWLMANLLIELGEPSPSGGATRPLAHRRDVCRQTPLPYLRPTLESLQLGNCHLLTDCSVFSFGFNDNQ